MTTFRDPVTGTPVPDDRDRLSWKPSGEVIKIKAIADSLYRWLDEQGLGEDGNLPEIPMVAHARDSYVTDHVLLTSALTYCLAYEEEMADTVELHVLRLAALSHELTPDSQTAIAERLPDEADFLKKAWQMLATQGSALDKAFENDESLSTFAGVEPGVDDPKLRVLWYAHLAASNRLHNQTWVDPKAPNDRWRDIASLKSRVDFDSHPLKGMEETIALVYGGATKIKSYVFESARLPEVRGASALFDRLNTLDVPALWGREPRTDSYLDPTMMQFAQQRYQMVREQFGSQFSKGALAAPECILYASGGNVLALAPRSLGNDLASAIEWLYTTETLVGNSVAVTVPFNLLELQYGRRPQDFWLDEFEQAIQTPEQERLLVSYYGGSEANHFIARKGFGEMVTLLAGQANKRRAGRGQEAGRHERTIPYYELLPQTMKCHSCDTRPALINIDRDQDTPANQSPKAFCEPCARKRVTGQVAKRDETKVTRWFTDNFDWYPEGVSSWEATFSNFLDNHLERKACYYTKKESSPEASKPLKGAQDIQEIGGGALPSGYVGYIYADGNDVGALVTRIRTPAAYRQFGQRLYLATQAAVFTAFSQHLEPHYQKRSPNSENRDRNEIWIHPFEIVTIGGDDLIVIVPGEKALPLAATIAQELERRLSGPRPNDGRTPTPEDKQERERYQSRRKEAAVLWTEDHWPAITLSAGVVIAQDHTPVVYISELAEQLQKSAKKARKYGHLDGYPGGTVDFAALKSTGMVSLPWSTYRQRAFRAEETYRLTARPYTWYELRGLMRTVSILKEIRFPRTQIYRLQEDLLNLNALAASVNYLYFLSHFSKEARQRILTEFHHVWHDEQDVPPWRKINGDSKETETIWRDLVEIYDFVSGPTRLAPDKEDI